MLFNYVFFLRIVFQMVGMQISLESGVMIRKALISKLPPCQIHTFRCLWLGWGCKYKFSSTFRPSEFNIFLRHWFNEFQLMRYEFVEYGLFGRCFLRVFLQNHISHDSSLLFLEFYGFGQARVLFQQLSMGFLDELQNQIVGLHIQQHVIWLELSISWQRVHTRNIQKFQQQKEKSIHVCLFSYNHQTILAGKPSQLVFRPHKNIIFIFVSMQGSLVDSAYTFANELKVKINFLRGVAFPPAQMIVKPLDRLSDLKNMLYEKYQTRFFVYLKKSFMPAPDSRMGDLVLCYGKVQTDRNDPTKKVYILPVDCTAEPEYG